MWNKQNFAMIAGKDQVYVDRSDEVNKQVGVINIMGPAKGYGKCSEQWLEEC